MFEEPVAVMSDIPKLFVFFPALGMPDPSPFPMKVAAFMRLHDIEYERMAGDVRTAPNGKIPYLEHKGKQIPDSELILDYLENEYSIGKDQLTPEQHATGHALCRMLDERTYWVVVHMRWIDEQNWPFIRELFFAPVPALMRGFISGRIRKSMKKTLWRHGIGRHSVEQMYRFARADLQVISDLLGDKDYLFGTQPTRYDCSALSFVGQCFQEGLPNNPIREIVEDMPNLPAYWQRGKERFFSEPL